MLQAGINLENFPVKVHQTFHKKITSPLEIKDKVMWNFTMSSFFTLIISAN